MDREADLLRVALLGGAHGGGSSLDLRTMTATTRFTSHGLHIQGLGVNQPVAAISQASWGWQVIGLTWCSAAVPAPSTVDVRTLQLLHHVI